MGRKKGAKKMKMPKRPWRDEKVVARKPSQQKRGRELAVPKAKGGDSRAVVPTQSQMYASGVSTTISQVIPAIIPTLYGVSYAYVCAALAKGWLANVVFPEYPFAAFQYLCSVFGNFVNGTVPQGTTLPYWMWAVGRAVSPKSVPKGGGEIYFKANLDVTMPSSAEYAIGPVAYGNTGNLFVPFSTETDLFPNATAPVSPSPAEQEQAFLSLCGFMKQDLHAPSVLHDSSVSTVLDKDVSAFSTIVTPTGYGNNTNGGTAFLATLEVPVHTPLVSTLIPQIPNGTTGSPTRFPNRSTEFGGDDMFASVAMSTLLDIKHWKTKKAPKFKCIDFLEVADVVAIWLSKLVTQYWKDPALAVSATTTTGAQDPTLTICPITLQEMTLILRNEILFVMGLTQSGTQAIFPIAPTGGGDNQFTPFLTGTTGCAVQSYGMMLPLRLVENLRGLILHSVPGNAPGDVELLCPVLGQYFLDSLVSSNYQFTSFAVGASPVLTNTFTATPPVLRRRKNSKGELWEKVTTETPISLITTNNGTSYVFINDPGRLKTLTDLWNDFVATFAAYSDPLTPISADPGVNVLTSVNQTRYWTPITSAAEQRAVDVRDTRVESRRSLVSTVYSAKSAVAVSFREKPFAATAAITTNWILPIMIINGGSNSTNEMSFVKAQSMYGEQASMSTSSTGDAGITLSVLHDDMATSMVHAKGEQSVVAQQLLDLSKKGEAGILSSLVANFVGSTFGTTAGSIASGIASVLPI